MKFSSPLLPGVLIKREKRFTAYVRLDSGEEVTAHCPNSGSMLDIKDQGTKVWLSKVPDHIPRKLRYTWEMVEMNGQFIGCNTSHPNNLVEEALQQQALSPLVAYNRWKREVKYGENSRIDFLLGSESLPPLFLEVKNVNLLRDGYAQFPDSVTERGAKHLRELSNIVAQGAHACVVYIIQREDVQQFKVAEEIDPTYAQASKIAHQAGVEFYAFACKISPQELIISHQIEVIQ